MKKITLVVLVLLAGLTAANAQKKSELFARIAALEATIGSLNDSISKANRQINASESKAELFEKENTELRDANATLLQNLTSFSKISKQNNETVNKALESLNAKERQLRQFTDSFTKNDSLAVVLVGQTKQTLGADTQVAIAGGAIVITQKLDFLFGSDTGTVVMESANDWLANVAQIILMNPDRSVTIEGLNITGEFEVSFNQAQAIGNTLWKNHAVPVARLKLVAKDGNFKEGIAIRLGPNYKAFYSEAKKTLKSQ